MQRNKKFIGLHWSILSEPIFLGGMITPMRVPWILYGVLFNNDNWTKKRMVITMDYCSLWSLSIITCTVNDTTLSVGYSSVLVFLLPARYTEVSICTDACLYWFACRQCSGREGWDECSSISMIGGFSLSNVLSSLPTNESAHTLVGFNMTNKKIKWQWLNIWILYIFMFNVIWQRIISYDLSKVCSHH